MRLTIDDTDVALGERVVQLLEKLQLARLTHTISNSSVLSLSSESDELMLVVNITLKVLKDLLGRT